MEMTNRANLVSRCDRLKSEARRVRDNRRALLSRYFRSHNIEEKRKLADKIEFANADLRIIELKIQKLGV